MKKNRIWWLIAAGVLLMGLGMLGSGAVLAAGRGSAGSALDLISVTGQAGATQDSAVLTLDDISEIQSAITGSTLSWWANGSGTIGTDTRNTQADVYAVSGAFQDFHHMNMLYGSFLPRTDAGGMAVVLDSDLAYRIFGTENAVGLEVQFDDKTFQVCGVCKSDSSLLGLMSSSGVYRAYVSGYDLITTGKLSIGGFEATLPRDTPGASLLAIQTAMQTQSKSTGSFLFVDKTQQMQLDAESALLPMVLFSIAAMIVLLVIFLKLARGIGHEAVVILKDSYFRNVWDALLWRLVKVLLAMGVCIGLSWLMWSSIGLNFFLPSKYIPGSWIDTTFYTGLIQSEAQAAIAAQTYTRMWWDTTYASAVQVSSTLNVIALFGLIISALSLRVLGSDRKAAAAQQAGIQAGGVWDLPLLWLFALLSFGATVLITVAIGLPIFTGTTGLVVLAVGLLAWVFLLHRPALESFFYNKQAVSVYENKSDELY